MSEPRVRRPRNEKTVRIITAQNQSIMITRVGRILVMPGLLAEQQVVSFFDYKGSYYSYTNVKTLLVS